jgi:hypothetical protein
MSQKYTALPFHMQEKHLSFQPLSPGQAVHAWSIDHLLRSVVLDDLCHNGKLGQDTRNIPYWVVHGGSIYDAGKGGEVSQAGRGLELMR